MADPTTRATEKVFLATPITGAGGTIAAPFQFLMTGEDNLLVTAWADDPTLTITLTGRFLKRDGEILPFVRSVPAVDTVGGLATLLPLGPGFLLNLSLVAADASVVWGRLYARVDVVRGSIGARVVLGQMVGGYVTGASYVAWPGSPILNPWEGVGYLREVSLVDPGAGLAVTYTAPAIARQQVVLVRATLATSATAATRRGALAITLPSGQSYGFSHVLAVGASAANVPFVWTAGLGDTGQDLAAPGPMPIPLETWLFPSMVFNIAATNMQAGDQWSNGRLLLRQWLSLP